MKYDWSKERVEAAAAISNCWFDCLDKLGIPKRGCNYRTLKAKLISYGINTSHFNYQYAKIHNGKHIHHSLANRQSSEIFCYNPPIKSENIKREYIRRFMNGIPRCEICGITEWNSKKIVFQIHHKDGDHKNQVVDNLQLLCPNCHSQTDYYSNKKRGK